MAAPGIAYGVEPNLSAAEFRRVLAASGLIARRPDDPERLARMLAGANLIVTARVLVPERNLVGIARVLTDFAWCAYVSDLAVDRAVQGRGIGRRLLETVRERTGPDVAVTLAAAPGADAFYERIGMPRLANAFRFDRES
ncbi:MULTISPECIES: GNAT family N-acetyltransferase [Methylobacterium]|uniref:GNAT family N-acetyltransferase n=1 Tax=Methylobacterium TaxID=407 RepID=UPI0010493B6A|nr:MULTISPECIES: GNAT family N-acetyltransferase [Methylobacterium]MDR7035558.1 GNAT superfamily N-acetyltransferase [Methylobacterium sp. BE186]